MLTTKFKHEIIIAVSQCLSIGMFLFLLFILYRTNSLQVNENVFIIDLLQNWEKRGVKQFYVDNSKSSEECGGGSVFFEREWEGTHPGCDCRPSYYYGVKSDIFKGRCSFMQIIIGCKEINEVSPSIAKKWKGAKLCVKPHHYNFYDSITIIGEKCPKKYVLCGTDTKNFNLCFPKHHGCPVNKIKVTNSHKLPKEEKQFFSNIKLNDDWYFHYSSDYNNNTLLIDVKYSEGRVCINPSETNIKSGYQKFKKIGLENYSQSNSDSITPLTPGPSCQTKIGKFNLDERFKIIDSVSKFKFYSDNGIMQKIEKLPQIYSQDLINYNSYLYERSYIHWSPFCRADQELAPEVIVNDLLNLATLDGYIQFLFWFFIFIFFLHSIHLSLRSILLHPGKKLNIDCFFDNFILILVITLIPLTILIIHILHKHFYLVKKFIFQKCGDYATNMAFTDIGRNLNDLSISVYQTLLMTVILLTVLILSKLIKN